MKIQDLKMHFPSLTVVLHFKSPTSSAIYNSKQFIKSCCFRLKLPDLTKLNNCLSIYEMMSFSGAQLQGQTTSLHAFEDFSSFRMLHVLRVWSEYHLQCMIYTCMVMMPSSVYDK